MKLGRSEFVEICDALACQRSASDARGDGSKGGSDKRIGARILVEAEVLVATLAPDGGPGEAFTALTRDISYAGVGLVQRTKVAQKSRLIVRLPREHQEPLVMLCTAIHVRELADGVYAVGAEFEKETTLGSPGTDAEEVDRVRKAVLNAQ